MNYDSADCLSKLVQTLGLPTTRSAPTDAQLYVLLSNAQERMTHLLAAHVPWTQYAAPERLTTTDGGLTYQFAYYPLGHVEIRESRSGALLVPGPAWADTGVDYLVEGQTIRWPNNSTRTFTDGPYARYVRMPEPITASSQPILQPVQARQAVIYDAAREWATQGGNQDPTPYKDLLLTFLWGDPQYGTVGLIPTLKVQYAPRDARLEPRWWAGNGWVGG